MPLLSRPVYPARFSEFCDALTGASHPGSPEYSYCFAQVDNPWFYAKVYIRYEFQCYPGTQREFHTGRVIAISLDSMGLHANHLAYFALVRDVREFTTNATFPWVCYHVTVEVHAIPELVVQWSDTVPWAKPFRNALFALPHCFAHNSYVLEPLEDIDEKDIIVVSLCLEMARMQADEDRRPPRLATADRLPPAVVYRHITRYPVYLSNRSLPIESLPEGVEEIERGLPEMPKGIYDYEDGRHDDMSAHSSDIDDDEVKVKVEEDVATFMFTIHEGNDEPSPSDMSSAPTAVDTASPPPPITLPQLSHLCAPMRPPLPHSLPSPPRLRSRRSLPVVTARAVTKSGHDDWSFQNAHMY